MSIKDGRTSVKRKRRKEERKLNKVAKVEVVTGIVTSIAF